MKVNLVSESVFFPKGHGVHTAFLNTKRLLQKKGQKVVTNSLKKADIVHIHTLGPLGLYKLLTSKKVVVSAHVIPDSFKGSIIGEKYWGKYARKYLTFFYNKADRVIAVAPQVAEQLKEIDVTVPIDIIPNAIDTDRFIGSTEMRKTGREKWKYKSEDFIAIASGQIQTRKGVFAFLDIAKKCPEIQFLWVGGTPFKGLTDQSPRLHKNLRNLPQNMHITGIIPYKNMPEIYNIADVFLFPSFQENAPMSVLEAGASHLPLLLRDLPEYKKLYKTGYLKASSEEEFIKSLKEIYNKIDLRQRYGDEGRKLALRFSYNILYEKLLATYNQVLEK